MLQVISPLKGFAIEASDGAIGTVADFLFDDASWKVRWLVIDCGTWLIGRKVLIHPSAILREDLEEQQFDVALTRAQVEGSPELSEDQPVSQQMESQLYSYYGWDPLWGGANLSAIPGAMASPLLAPHYMGLGSTNEAEARGDGATSRAGRSASAQRRRNDRVPGSCRRWRNWSCRKSHDRRRGLEHSLFHRRHTELVVWKARADFTDRSESDQLVRSSC